VPTRSHAARPRWPRDLRNGPEAAFHFDPTGRYRPPGLPRTGIRRLARAVRLVLSHLVAVLFAGAEDLPEPLPQQPSFGCGVPQELHGPLRASEQRAEGRERKPGEIGNDLGVADRPIHVNRDRRQGVITSLPKRNRGPPVHLVDAARRERHSGGELKTAVESEASLPLHSVSARRRSRSSVKALASRSVNEATRLSSFVGGSERSPPER
jgi:hypothetical protein